MLLVLHAATACLRMHWLRDPLGQLLQTLVLLLRGCGCTDVSAVGAAVACLLHAKHPIAAGAAGGNAVAAAAVAAASTPTAGADPAAGASAPL